MVAMKDLTAWNCIGEVRGQVEQVRLKLKHKEYEKVPGQARTVLVSSKLKVSWVEKD